MDSKRHEMEHWLSNYEHKPKHEVVESECQNCGKPVTLVLPFDGCLFCKDCRNSNNVYTASTESIQ